MKTRWSVVTAMAAAALLAACVAGAAGVKADQAPGGKDLFVTSKCNSCHSIETEKVELKKTANADKGAATATAARKKPDLSGVGAKKDAAWISQYLLKEVKLETKLHPSVKLRGTPEELQVLSDWLASLKTPGKKEVSSK